MPFGVALGCYEIIALHLYAIVSLYSKLFTDWKSTLYLPFVVVESWFHRLE
jgi:hypothetical protein